MLQTLTDAHPPLPLGEVSSIISNFAAMTNSEKKLVIERLVNVHPTLSMACGPGWKYRRCRKLDKGEVPEHVNELIWRQGVPAQLGRANPPGYQVLYLADRRDTALTEARVTCGPAVVAEFVIQQGKAARVVPLGELAQVHRTGRGFLAGSASAELSALLNACSYEDALSLLITDTFLLDCFVGHDDYDISSHVAISIFKKLSTVSAVAYPSRRQNGGLNFAVSTEGFWDAWGLSSASFGIAKHYAMGYFDMPTIKGVSGVFRGGQLRWQDMPEMRGRLMLEPAYVPVSA